MENLTNLQKLKNWLDEAKRNGLIDVKFCALGLERKDGTAVDIELEAGCALALLEGTPDSVDITHVTL